MKLLKFILKIMQLLVKFHKKKPQKLQKVSSTNMINQKHIDKQDDC